MKTLTLLLLILTSSISFAESKQNNDEKIIAVGEQIAVPVKNLKQYSIGNETIITAKFDALTNSILVKGKMIGFSDIIIWENHQKESRKITFRIISRRTAGFEEDVRQALSHITGIKISVLGERVIVDGVIDSLEDIQTIQKICSKKSEFVNIAKLSNKAQSEAILKFKTITKNLNLTNVTAEYKNDIMFVSGKVANETELATIKQTSDEIFGQSKLNVEVENPSARSLVLDVYFLETTRTETENLGIKWSVDGGSSLSFPGFKYTQNFLLQNSIEASLKEGKSKILAAPQITLKKGANAELNAGGEIPIKSTGKYIANIMFKQYGLILKVSLKDLTNFDAKIDITAEMSSLDNNTAIEGIPGFKTNKISTSLDAELNKTVFLTGLVRQDTSEDLDKLPLIGNLPIIGKLFTSSSFRDKKTELTIAILPKIKTKVVKKWMQ